MVTTCESMATCKMELNYAEYLSCPEYRQAGRMIFRPFTTCNLLPQNLFLKYYRISLEVT